MAQYILSFRRTSSLKGFVVVLILVLVYQESTLVVQCDLIW